MILIVENETLKVLMKLSRKLCTLTGSFLEGFPSSTPKTSLMITMIDQRGRGPEVTNILQ